jgi:uncharacterized protein YaaQ
MKLIVAILRDNDNDAISNRLVEMGCTVTQIASTSGLLRQGRCIFMVGIEDEYVDDAIQAINDICEPTVEPYLKRATIFVLNVEHFEKV